MKKNLLLVTILLIFSLITNAQSISPVNFLKLFHLGSSESAVEAIDKGLNSLSPTWELNGDKEGSSSYTLIWKFKFATEATPAAEFYLTSIRTDENKLLNKIAYVFLSEQLFRRYISAVANLNDCKVVYSKIEDNGERKTIYENPYSAFIFREIPVKVMIEGKSHTKSYSVEMHNQLN